MAWYRIGTVTVTNGSDVVNGIGTSWVGNVQPSDGIVLPDGKYYEVEQVVSNTQLLIVESYPGSTVGAPGAAYKVVPTQGRVRDLATQVSQLILDYGSVEAALTVLGGNLGLGKSPNASAKLDVNGQVWVDSPSGAATVRMLTAGTERGRVAVESSGRMTLVSAGKDTLVAFDGNVGLGTTAPAAMLHINSASTANNTPRIRFTNVTSGTTDTDGAFVGVSNGTGLDLWNYEAGPVRLATSNIERLVVTAAGNVGLSDSAPAYRLVVNGQVQVKDFFLRNNLANVVVSNDSLAAGTTRVGAGGSSAGTITFHRTSVLNTSDESMRITSVGNVGVGTTAPQARMDVSGGQLVCQSVNTFFSTKFNSNGAAWSDQGDAPALIMNGAAPQVPEFSTYRGARSYPQFTVRQNPTHDAGGQILSGTGLAVPILAATFDAFGNTIFAAKTAAPTLSIDGQVVFNLTSATNLRISARSGGVTRVANITLA